MIKKISQLNRLPERLYKNVEDRPDLKEKKDGMLLEVSYETNKPANPTNADQEEYYTSYNTTLLALGEMLGVDEISVLRNSLSVIDNGGLSAISGNLVVGSPTAMSSDLVDQYHTDPNHAITIYSKAEIDNDLKVHGKTTFHNEVLIDSTNDNSRALLVNGYSQFKNTIHGTALRACWADLAEIYKADEPYEPGTLVKFGGSAEITIASDKANAVVTTKPGLVLNGGDGLSSKTDVGIALVGRVPVKVSGIVKKFDKIVLSKTKPGVGIVQNYGYSREVIGRALEENFDPGVKLVECATNFNLQ